MDTISPAQRSDVMRRIRKTDTGPEWVVRRLLHGEGYRYRLYRQTLPGNPDLVFIGRRKAIFVHGCFWHQHDCSLGRLPKSRLDYWIPKLLGNKARHEKNLAALTALGWKSLTVWECETKRANGIMQGLRRFLGPPATARGSRQIKRKHRRS